MGVLLSFNLHLFVGEVNFPLPKVSADGEALLLRTPPRAVLRRRTSCMASVYEGRDGRGLFETKEKPMNSTFIPNTELKDLSSQELQSKFFRVQQDVELLRQRCGQLPMAEASLANIRSELMRRRIKGPKP